MDASSGPGDAAGAANASPPKRARPASEVPIPVPWNDLTTTSTLMDALSERLSLAKEITNHVLRNIGVWRTTLGSMPVSMYVRVSVRYHCPSAAVFMFCFGRLCRKEWDDAGLHGGPFVYRTLQALLQEHVSIRFVLRRDVPEN